MQGGEGVKTEEDATYLLVVRFYTFKRALVVFLTFRTNTTYLIVN